MIFIILFSVNWRKVLSLCDHLKGNYGVLLVQYCLTFRRIISRGKRTRLGLSKQGDFLGLLMDIC